MRVSRAHSMKESPPLALLSRPSVERMKREYGVECTVGEPRVNYRETITQKASFNYLHKKQVRGALCCLREGCLAPDASLVSVLAALGDRVAVLASSPASSGTSSRSRRAAPTLSSRTSSLAWTFHPSSSPR